mmetsp:Transcript_82161/g.214117  ORF Transcript_82161/g.214117 Transcript_82161/m.214117 type:complete len:131 (+) Transcript_82161:115-507(+)
MARAATILLFLLCFSPSAADSAAPEPDQEVRDILLQNDECAVGEDCALNALQLRKGQLSVEEKDATASGDEAGKTRPAWCAEATGGTCDFEDCAAWRGAGVVCKGEVLRKQCLCERGYCAYGGKCVPVKW